METQSSPLKVSLIRELTASLMSGPKTKINSMFGKE